MFVKEFAEWMHRARSGEAIPLHALLPLSHWTVALDLVKDRSGLGRRCTVAELHAPIQHLAETAPLELVLELAGNIGRDAFAWPAELSDPQLAENLARDRKRWSATLVEYADRAGKLDAMVESLVDGNPAKRHALALVQKYQARLAWIDDNAITLPEA
jgi:hypothetical protein